MNDNGYCYECGDSRYDMDPSDQYPDMGSWQLLPSGWTAWVCDVCTEDNEKERA